MACPAEPALVPFFSYRRFKPGKVWFTIEALKDDEENRYSVMKSAATIAIISVRHANTARLAGADSCAHGPR